MHTTNLPQQRGQRGSPQACETDRQAEILMAGREEVEKADNSSYFCWLVEGRERSEGANSIFTFTAGLTPLLVGGKHGRD